MFIILTRSKYFSINIFVKKRLKSLSLILGENKLVNNKFWYFNGKFLLKLSFCYWFILIVCWIAEFHMFSLNFYFQFWELTERFDSKQVSGRLREFVWYSNFSVNIWILNFFFNFENIRQTLKIFVELREFSLNFVNFRQFSSIFLKLCEFP